MNDLIGSSTAMQSLRERVTRYAASDATVLIAGETGTGKELAAQALHAASGRRKGPFIAVNCGAIAESLLESELFGYEEGAFTGSRRGGRVGLIEAAHGGTLFLDEIGEMPLALQTRLLRVLEEREVTRVGASVPASVDLRVVAATHCDLDALVRESRFRRDLYYRLNVLRLDLPPLREHAEDIPALVQHFLQRSVAGKAIGLAPDALTLLLAHGWPGNVRELRNVVERWPVLLAGSAKVDVGLLQMTAPELQAPPKLPQPMAAAVNMTMPSDSRLAAVLAQVGGNRGRAAAILGVSRTTLWRWLRQGGMDH